MIRRNQQTGEISLDPLRWGLIPYWCQDPKGGRKPINAKCETVHTLPTFGRRIGDGAAYSRSMGSSKPSKVRKPSSLTPSP
jgi:hypothetical protein